MPDPARQRQDARLRYHPGPADPAWRPALVAALRAELGWPALGPCQDETVEVLSCTPEEGGWRVQLRYSFDHDFASQYDRTEEREVWVALDPAGHVRAQDVRAQGSGHVR